MSYLFYISVIVVCFLLLKRDYITTRGYLSQKVIHVFTITFILFTNFTAFRNLFAIIKHFDAYSEWNIYSQVENFPQSIGLTLSLISCLLGVISYVSAFGLLSRANFSRIIIIWIIPFIIILRIPIIQSLYKNNYNSLEQIITFWVLIVVLAIYLGIFFLYNSKYIKSFFYAKKTVRPAEPASADL